MAFDLEYGTLTDGKGQEHEILSWEVWYATPFGLFSKREDAVNRVKSNDFDPTTVIQPVVVMVAEKYYEVLIRS